MMDASAEFQVFLSPTSKWRERTQGIRQRLVPVITNMTTSNGFSLNHRSQNVYKAVSGVSFQDTDIRGRKKKLSKKEKLGERKSESEPSIFRSKKEQFKINQFCKKSDSNESNHNRSNSTKRKPSFEFRPKDLATVPINPVMEPNKIARTSSKKERARSSSQVREVRGSPMPLGDRTNSFEFPIRPRRARSSSRTRNSTGQMLSSSDIDNIKNRKKSLPNTRQYCSFTPWKNIDVIRNVEDFKIYKDPLDDQDKHYNSNKTSEHMYVKPGDHLQSKETILPAKSNEIPQEKMVIEKNIDKALNNHTIKEPEVGLYDNINFPNYEECFEAESSSEVIYVSQTVEVTPDLIPDQENENLRKSFVSEMNIQFEDPVYDYIDPPDDQVTRVAIKLDEQKVPSDKVPFPNVTCIASTSDPDLKVTHSNNEKTKKNEVSVINITMDDNGIYDNLNIKEDNSHKPLVNKISGVSVLSNGSSDYDYVADFEVNLDLSDEEEEDVSIYSTYIPNSEVKPHEIQPILPRVSLPNPGEQSMRLRVNGQFVDVSKFNVNKKSKQEDVPFHTHPLTSSNQIKLRDSELKNKSWQNVFGSHKDTNNIDNKKTTNYSISQSKSEIIYPNRYNKKDKKEIQKSSSIYKENINVNDNDNEDNIALYPEPLYEPIVLKPYPKDLKIPRVSSQKLSTPKTFKDFLENKCFNPTDSDYENIYDEKTPDCDSNSFIKPKFEVKNIPNNRTDDDASQSWLETSSEFEFVNLRKDDKKTTEFIDVSPYPTLSSLPAPYTAPSVIPSSSGITL